MPQAVKRIFVEKKSGFDVEAHSLYSEFKQNLAVKGLAAVRVVNRYDLAGVTDEEYARSRNTIFAEPNLDNVYDEELPVAAAPTGCSRWNICPASMTSGPTRRPSASRY